MPRLLYHSDFCGSEELWKEYRDLTSGSQYEGVQSEDKVGSRSRWHVFDTTYSSHVVTEGDKERRYACNAELSVETTCVSEKLDSEWSPVQMRQGGSGQSNQPAGTEAQSTVFRKTVTRMAEHNIFYELPSGKRSVNNAQRPVVEFDSSIDQSKESEHDESMNAPTGVVGGSRDISVRSEPESGEADHVPSSASSQNGSDETSVEVSSEEETETTGPLTETPPTSASSDGDGWTYQEGGLEDDAGEEDYRPYFTECFDQIRKSYGTILEEEEEEESLTEQMLSTLPEHKDSMDGHVSLGAESGLHARMGLSTDSGHFDLDESSLLLSSETCTEASSDFDSMREHVAASPEVGGFPLAWSTNLLSPCENAQQVTPMKGEQKNVIGNLSPGDSVSKTVPIVEVHEVDWPSSDSPSPVEPEQQRPPSCQDVGLNDTSSDLEGTNSPFFTLLDHGIMRKRSSSEDAVFFPSNKSDSQHDLTSDIVNTKERPKSAESALGRKRIWSESVLVYKVPCDPSHSSKIGFAKQMSIDVGKISARKQGRSFSESIVVTDGVDGKEIKCSQKERDEDSTTQTRSQLAEIAVQINNPPDVFPSDLPLQYVEPLGLKSLDCEFQGQKSTQIEHPVQRQVLLDRQLQVEGRESNDMELLIQVQAVVDNELLIQEEESVDSENRVQGQEPDDRSVAVHEEVSLDRQPVVQGQGSCEMELSNQTQELIDREIPVQRQAAVNNKLLVQGEEPVDRAPRVQGEEPADRKYVAQALESSDKELFIQGEVSLEKELTDQGEESVEKSQMTQRQKSVDKHFAPGEGLVDSELLAQEQKSGDTELMEQASGEDPVNTVNNKRMARRREPALFTGEQHHETSQEGQELNSSQILELDILAGGMTCDVLEAVYNVIDTVYLDSGISPVTKSDTNQLERLVGESVDRAATGAIGQMQESGAQQSVKDFHPGSGRQLSAGHFQAQTKMTTEMQDTVIVVSHVKETLVKHTSEEMHNAQAIDEAVDDQDADVQGRSPVAVKSGKLSNIEIRSSHADEVQMWDMVECKATSTSTCLSGSGNIDLRERPGMELEEEYTSSSNLPAESAAEVPHMTDLLPGGTWEAVTNEDANNFEGIEGEDQIDSVMKVRDRNEEMNTRHAAVTDAVVTDMEPSQQEVGPSKQKCTAGAGGDLDSSEKGSDSSEEGVALEAVATVVAQSPELHVPHLGKEPEDEPSGEVSLRTQDQQSSSAEHHDYVGLETTPVTKIEPSEESSGVIGEEYIDEKEVETNKTPDLEEGISGGPVVVEGTVVTSVELSQKETSLLEEEQLAENVTASEPSKVSDVETQQEAVSSKEHVEQVALEASVAAEGVELHGDKSALLGEEPTAAKDKQCLNHGPELELDWEFGVHKQPVVASELLVQREESDDRILVVQEQAVLDRDCLVPEPEESVDRVLGVQGEEPSDQKHVVQGEELINGEHMVPLQESAHRELLIQEDNSVDNELTEQVAGEDLVNTVNSKPMGGREDLALLITEEHHETSLEGQELNASQIHELGNLAGGMTCDILDAAYHVIGTIYWDSGISPVTESDTNQLERVVSEIVDQAMTGAMSQMQETAAQQSVKDFHPEDDRQLSAGHFQAQTKMTIEMQDTLAVVSYVKETLLKHTSDEMRNNQAIEVVADHNVDVQAKSSVVVNSSELSNKAARSSHVDEVQMWDVVEHRASSTSTCLSGSGNVDVRIRSGMALEKEYRSPSDSLGESAELVDRIVLCQEQQTIDRKMLKKEQKSSDSELHAQGLTVLDKELLVQEKESDDSKPMIKGQKSVDRKHIDQAQDPSERGLLVQGQVSVDKGLMVPEQIVLDNELLVQGEESADKGLMGKEQTAVENERVVEEDESVDSENTAQKDEAIVKELLVQGEESVARKGEVQVEESAEREYMGQARESGERELPVSRQASLDRELMVPEQTVVDSELVVHREESADEGVVGKEQTVVDNELVVQGEELADDGPVGKEQTVVDKELILEEDESSDSINTAQKGKAIVKELPVDREKSVDTEHMDHAQEAGEKELVVQREEADHKECLVQGQESSDWELLIEGQAVVAKELPVKGEKSVDRKDEVQGGESVEREHMGQAEVSCEREGLVQGEVSDDRGLMVQEQTVVDKDLLGQEEEPVAGKDEVQEEESAEREHMDQAQESSERELPGPGQASFDKGLVVQEQTVVDSELVVQGEQSADKGLVGKEQTAVDKDLLVQEEESVDSEKTSQKGEAVVKEPPIQGKKSFDREQMGHVQETSDGERVVQGEESDHRECLVQGQESSDTKLLIEGQAVVSKDLLVEGEKSVDGKDEVQGGESAEREYMGQAEVSRERELLIPGQASFDKGLMVQEQTVVDSELVMQGEKSADEGVVGKEQTAVDNELVVQGEESVDSENTAQIDEAIVKELPVDREKSVDTEHIDHAQKAREKELVVQREEADHRECLVQGQESSNWELLIEGQAVVDKELPVEGEKSVDRKDEVQGEESAEREDMGQAQEASETEFPVEQQESSDMKLLIQAQAGGDKLLVQGEKSVSNESMEQPYGEDAVNTVNNKSMARRGDLALFTGEQHHETSQEGQELNASQILELDILAGGMTCDVLDAVYDVIDTVYLDSGISPVTESDTNQLERLVGQIVDKAGAGALNQLQETTQQPLHSFHTEADDRQLSAGQFQAKPRVTTGIENSATVMTDTITEETWERDTSKDQDFLQGIEDEKQIEMVIKIDGRKEESDIKKCDLKSQDGQDASQKNAAVTDAVATEMEPSQQEVGPLKQKCTAGAGGDLDSSEKGSDCSERGVALEAVATAVAQSPELHVPHLGKEPEDEPSGEVSLRTQDQQSSSAEHHDMTMTITVETTPVTKIEPSEESSGVIGEEYINEKEVEINKTPDLEEGISGGPVVVEGTAVTSVELSQKETSLLEEEQLAENVTASEPSKVSDVETQQEAVSSKEHVEQVALEASVPAEGVELLGDKSALLGEEPTAIKVKQLETSTEPDVPMEEVPLSYAVVDVTGFTRVEPSQDNSALLDEQSSLGETSSLSSSGHLSRAEIDLRLGAEASEVRIKSNEPLLQDTQKSKPVMSPSVEKLCEMQRMYEIKSTEHIERFFLSLPVEPAKIDKKHISQPGPRDLEYPTIVADPEVADSEFAPATVDYATPKKGDSKMEWVRTTGTPSGVERIISGLTQLSGQSPVSLLNVTAETMAKHATCDDDYGSVSSTSALTHSEVASTTGSIEVEADEKEAPDMPQGHYMGYGSPSMALAKNRKAMYPAVLVSALPGIQAPKTADERTPSFVSPDWKNEFRRASKRGSGIQRSRSFSPVSGVQRKVVQRKKKNTKQRPMSASKADDIRIRSGSDSSQSDASSGLRSSGTRPAVKRRLMLGTKMVGRNGADCSFSSRSGSVGSGSEGSYVSESLSEPMPGRVPEDTAPEN